MPVIYYNLYKPISSSAGEIDRQESSIGRELLIRGLSDIYGLPYSIEESGPQILFGQNGKPYLPDHPDIFFNITHCRGLVACAFHSAPIGIDAEHTGYFPEVLIKRALSPAEQECIASYSASETLRQECFWRFWTLKEAYFKRSGIGVDTDLKQVSFDLCEIDTASRFFPVPCSDPDVSCCQMMFESGYIISVCTDTSADETTMVRW